MKNRYVEEYDNPPERFQAPKTDSNKNIRHGKNKGKKREYHTGRRIFSEDDSPNNENI